MLNSHGGGLHGSLPARFAANFQLSGHEKFPPLEHLMLVDYSICTPERALWRDKMDWQRLTSLTLKGQAIGNLALMRGLVKNLKVLRLHGWSWVNGDRRVTEFIHSFKGLEEIELDGFYVSAYTLGMHPDLKSLSVRTPGYRVANHWGTFYAGEIRELHTRCTRIRYLDLEIYGSIEQVSLSSFFHQLMTLQLPNQLNNRLADKNLSSLMTLFPCMPHTFQISGISICVFIAGTTQGNKF